MTPTDASPNRLPGRKGDDVHQENDPDSLGAVLRARREELGLSLTQVEAWLRIRVVYIEALESGKIATLPGTAYAVGFLRTYADALGLDGAAMVSRFRQGSPASMERVPPLSFPQPVSDRTIPLGLWVGIGLVAVVAAYAGYYHFSAAPVETARYVPPANELMPGVTEKGTTSPQIASVLPERGEAPTPRSAPTTAAAAPGTPVSGATAPDPGPSTPETASSPSAPATGVPPSVAPAVNSVPAVMPQEAASSPVTSTLSPDAIVVEASADSWVQIKDHNGGVVLNRVLKAGENWQADGSGAPYRMTVGNAGGITLRAGNVTTGPLGRAGAVLRGVPVSAYDIVGGKFAGATPDTTSVPARPVAAENTAPRSRPAPAATPATNSSETDRLNAGQLEHLAQPR